MNKKMTVARALVPSRKLFCTLFVKSNVTNEIQAPWRTFLGGGAELSRDEGSHVAVFGQEIVEHELQVAHLGRFIVVKSEQMCSKKAKMRHSKKRRNQLTMFEVVFFCVFFSPSSSLSISSVSMYLLKHRKYKIIVVVVIIIDFNMFSLFHQNMFLDGTHSRIVYCQADSSR